MAMRKQLRRDGLRNARIGFMSIFVTASCGCEHDPRTGVAPPALRVDTATIMTAPVVVPTLDTPTPADRSAVWCATFQVAWNRLKAEVIRDNVRVQGAEEIANRLNEAPSIEKDLPDGSWYAAAGYVDDGVLDRIRRDLEQRFPGTSPPEVPKGSNSVVAFGHLEVVVPFSRAFFNGREPLVFKCGAGPEFRVQSFGIGSEHSNRYAELRSQVAVLYARMDDMDSRRGAVPRPVEFIIDPCATSAPSQIVLACVEPSASLAETVAHVEAAVRSGAEDRRLRPRFGSADGLAIPRIAFDMVHRFQELEGRDRLLLNAALEGRCIATAVQTVQFRLERNGAAIRSDAQLVSPALATDYSFDRPFLVYVKRRGSAQPYFAMWVSDADLLFKY